MTKAPWRKGTKMVTHFADGLFNGRTFCGRFLQGINGVRFWMYTNRINKKVPWMHNICVVCMKRWKKGRG